MSYFKAQRYKPAFFQCFSGFSYRINALLAQKLRAGRDRSHEGHKPKKAILEPVLFVNWYVQEQALICIQSKSETGDCQPTSSNLCGRGTRLCTSGISRTRCSYETCGSMFRVVRCALNLLWNLQTEICVIEFVDFHERFQS